MKRLIRGGILYDGTGAAPRKADLLIENGRIAAVGRLEIPPGTEVLEAAGKIVTPGFIDMHRHCDVAVLCDPDFGRRELAQGITSTVGGNCGLAPLPVTASNRMAVYGYIQPVVGYVPERFYFETHAEYVQRLNAVQLPINVGFLVAAGTVKMTAHGFGPGPYSRRELDHAVGMVREGMQAGARGISLGIMYQPECWSDREEMIELVRPAAEAGGILCTHIRGEGDSLVESVQEVIDIANRAEIPLNISHLKATGQNNWRRKIFEAIDCIETARARGQQVTADFYPYTCGATTLQSLLPPTMLTEDPDELLRILESRAGRQRLRTELARHHPGWDNMVASIGWRRIILSSAQEAEFAPFVGQSLDQIASLRGNHPVDLMADLLVAEHGQVGILLQSMDSKDVDTVACLPYTALISDALYADTGSPHPRLNAAFPQFIRDFVLDRQLLSMEQAIYKMTGLPAQCMGLKDRGVLRPGARADLLIFHPDDLRRLANYSDPCRLADGIDSVMVNGAFARQEGGFTREKRGEFLRFSRQDHAS